MEQEDGMVSRKFAWSIVLTALALWGCDGLPPGETFPERDFVCAQGEAPPCETTEPARTDAQRTHEPGTELENESRTYVINVLDIPTGENGMAPGFNLDGIDSGDGDGGATCQEFRPDYVSPADPDHAGVDNALIDLLNFAADALGGTDLNAEVAEQLASGDLLLLVKVTGIDSFSYDTDITMQLALGALPEGAEIQLEGGFIAPDQEFEVEMDLGPAVNGDIFNGRLRGTVQNITIPINTSDFSLDLAITSPQVRFDISETGLENGVIGGVLTVADLVSALASIPALEEFCSGDPDCAALGSVLGMYADVSPSADPNYCEEISVGLGFGATTARIAE